MREQNLKDRFDELVQADLREISWVIAFLQSKGHSDERARQIVGNLADLADELRAEFKKQRGA